MVECLLVLVEHMEAHASFVISLELPKGIGPPPHVLLRARHQTLFKCYHMNIAPGPILIFQSIYSTINSCVLFLAIQPIPLYHPLPKFFLRVNFWFV